MPNKHRYPMVRIRSPIASQLTDKPESLAVAANAALEIVAGITPNQRQKLEAIAIAVGADSIANLIKMLADGKLQCCLPPTLPK